MNIFSKDKYEIVEIKPNSINQLQFLENAPDNDETLFAGAAGPGKSLCAVWLPIYHGMTEVSGFRGQIFRTTRPELEESIIPYTKTYYPLAGGNFNEQKLIWTFPSGAKIRLCYMEHDGDWKRYQGGNNTYQAFDEAGNFLPGNLETMSAWNRSGCGINAFRVYLSNPGGPAHLKLKKEFVDKCPPVPDGKIRYSLLAKMWWQPVRAGLPFYDVTKVSGNIVKFRRQYIPARIFNNEDLLKTNPNYLNRLLLLPEGKRKMLLDGDWDFIQGQFFNTFSSEIQVYHGAPFNPPESWELLAGLDYGNTTCAEFIAEDERGDVWVWREWTAIDKSKSYKAFTFKDYLRKIGHEEINVVGDTNMFGVLKEDPTEKTPAEAFINLGVNLYEVSKKSPDNRKFRVWINDELKDLMDWSKKNGLWTKKPRIHIIKERCPKLIETLPLLETDENYAEDYKKEQDRTIAHWVKALQYALISRRRRFTKEMIADIVKKMKERAAKRIS